MNSAFLVFIVTLSVFSAFIIGKSKGYAEAITDDEQKKGIQQKSRMPWNRKF